MARTRIKVIKIDGKQAIIETCVGGLFRENISGIRECSSNNIHGRSKSRRKWLQKTGEKIRNEKEKEARRAAAYAKHDELMWHIEQKYLNA